MTAISESYEAIKALTEIDITEFTANVEKVEDENGAITGTGIFDILMNTATKHLQVQFDSGKINGELYASAYIQVYQVTLQTAKDIWLQKGISEAQLALLSKQINSEDAKRDLYRRQIEGFDEDYKQKILKIMMDSWAVGFSVSKDSFQASGIPATMQKTTIDDLYNSYIRTDFDNYTYVRTDKTITGSDTAM